MKLKSERMRRDRLASLDKRIREIEERFPHFARWLELLLEHSDQPLERLGSCYVNRKWPEAFYRATGVATLFMGKKHKLPNEYAFFCYIEALTYRNKLLRAEVKSGYRGSVPIPDPVEDSPKYEPIRAPKE